MHILRTKTSIEEIEGDPQLAESLRSAVQACRGQMLPNDELWWFDCMPCSGLAIVRDQKVISEVYVIHALILPPTVLITPNNPNGSYSVQQLQVLRQQVPAFRDRPLKEVAAELKCNPRICITCCLEAQTISDACRKVGMLVELG